jgi:aryl carrier-like protein
MSTFTPTDVQLFLKDYLNRELQATERGSCEDLPEGCDLLLSGMIDSLGLLELLEALREFSGSDIDFEALDPEEMTIVGPLCRFVSEQTSNVT